MLYKTAGLEDIPDLVRLRIEFLREVSPRIEIDHLAFSQELGQYFSQHIAANDFINWLAVENGVIISTGAFAYTNIRLPSMYR